MTANRFIISTDLDGTLLDHYDYSWAAAVPALSLCRDLGVPVILNTSKTQVEAETLRDELGLLAPVVIENGSALLIPLSRSSNDLLVKNIDDQADVNVRKGEHNLRVVFGVERLAILGFIEKVRFQHAWQFAGFNDWSVDEISQRTGLPKSAAAAAAQKRYTEPIVWQDSASKLEEFQALAKQAGFSLMKGGRFYHLQGQTDKAKPLAWLKKNASLVFETADGYSQSGNSQPKLICLGDNHNDVAMLNFADIPVCVRSPVADYPSLSKQKSVIYTDLEGPKGWNEAVQNILRNFGKSPDDCRPSES